MHAETLTSGGSFALVGTAFGDEHMMGMMASGPEAQKARSAMSSFIKQRTVGGTFYYYDPVDSRLLSLKFDDLHKEVMQDGQFMMACSDFHDRAGPQIRY
jgi:hypothetical protein